MAESKEDQTKPLSPLYLTSRSDQPTEDQHCNNPTKHIHHHLRTRLLLCCGLVLSLTILIAVTLIVLSVTVFHLRNPNLTVESISFIQPLNFVNGKVNTDQNAIVLVEISLHNPNAARFKVKKATVSFLNGELKGSGIRETIPAKHTVKMNLTAEIVTTKLVADFPSLMEDLNNGRGVDLKSSVEVIGKVKITGAFKKSINLKTDCSMKIMNISSKPTFVCFRA